MLAVKHPGKRKCYLDIDCKLRELERLTKEDLDSIALLWELDEMIGNPERIAMIEIDPSRKDPKKGFDATQPKPKGFQRQVDITNELLKLAWEAKKGGPAFPYDCAIWDSGTRTSHHLIEAILYKHQYGSMTETLWGVYGTQFLKYWKGFLSLPCDRIVIFHEYHKTRRNRENEIIEEKIRPSLYGASADIIDADFSEVYRFLGRNTEAKYHIRTVAEALAPGRTSKANLPARFEIDLTKPETLKTLYG